MGALADTTVARADAPPTESRTVCSYCGVGCGIAVSTTTGPLGTRITKTVGDKLHPANAGRLCTKGATHVDLMHAPGRMATALPPARPRRGRGRRTDRHRDRRGGSAPARDRRGARPRRGCGLRLGADVDRGAVPLEQAREGLPPGPAHRVQLAAVHGIGRHRLQAVPRARTARPDRTRTSTRPTCSSSSGRTWRTAIRSCSCGWRTASSRARSSSSSTRGGRRPPTAPTSTCRSHREPTSRC